MLLSSLMNHDISWQLMTFLSHSPPNVKVKQENKTAAYLYCNKGSKLWKIIYSKNIYIINHWQVRICYSAEHIPNIWTVVDFTSHSTQQIDVKMFHSKNKYKMFYKWSHYNTFLLCIPLINQFIWELLWGPDWSDSSGDQHVWPSPPPVRLDRELGCVFFCHLEVYQEW